MVLTTIWPRPPPQASLLCSLSMLELERREGKNAYKRRKTRRRRPVEPETGLWVFGDLLIKQGDWLATLGANVLAVAALAQVTGNWLWSALMAIAALCVLAGLSLWEIGWIAQCLSILTARTNTRVFAPFLTVVTFAQCGELFITQVVFRERHVQLDCRDEDVDLDGVPERETH